MEAPKIVPKNEWLEARKALLAKERDLVHARDALAAERRALPCVLVEKPYLFIGPGGRASLLDLFAGRDQLVVQHFMFSPEKKQGCAHCSFLADTYDGAALHLPAAGVTFAAVSRAPFEKIDAFRRRMGWRFNWYSSSETDFNYDYQASFDPKVRAAGPVHYNYTEMPFPHDDAPGVSVFRRDGEKVFHTYSTYSRGLDPLIGTYGLLDLTPGGRNEEAPNSPMSWVRHHDLYPAA